MLKSYTIIRNTASDDNEIFLVRTNEIQDSVYLNYSEDKSQVYNSEADSLTPTEDFYPKDYFDRHSNERLVMTLEDYNEYYGCRLTEDDVCNDDEWVELAIDWDGPTFVKDITDEWMSYSDEHIVSLDYAGKEYTFAIGGDYGTWETVDEVCVIDTQMEHEEKYPTQNMTRLLYLDNGEVLRETSSYYEGDLETYEYVR